MSRGYSRGAHDRFGFFEGLILVLISSAIWFGILWVCFGGLK